jgi:RNA polymerase sigma-70 factor (ECF subfamily)
MRDAEPGPDTVTDRSSFRQAVLAALEKLPERQRLATVLFDVEGYSHREISEVLDVPIGTVRSDVFHARRTMRGELDAWKDWRESE